MSKRRERRRWHIGDRACWHREYLLRDTWTRYYRHGVIDGIRGDLVLIGGELIPSHQLKPVEHRAVWHRRWGHEHHRRTVGG